MPFEFDDGGMTDMNSPVSHGTYGKHNPKPDIDLIYGGKAFPVSDSNLVLEIQSRLLGFLVSACGIILHDKRALFDGTDIPVQPEPEPLPEHDCEWDSVVQLAAERPYNAPQKTNLDELLSLAQAKLDESRDHAWSLREDPSYYFGVTQEHWNHRPERILDTGGRHNRGITDPGQQTTRFGEVLSDIIHRAYSSHRSWEVVVDLLKKTIRLDKAFVSSGKSFEADCPEHLVVMEKLRMMLEVFMMPVLLRNLGIWFPSSPNMRHHFERLDRKVTILRLKIFCDKFLWLFPQLFAGFNLNGNPQRSRQSAHQRTWSSRSRGSWRRIQHSSPRYRH